jgi:hypothetical protein
MSKTLKREELYELVWSHPMRKLATEFGISDVGLAKTCRRAHIPVPERGYWAKSQAGKPANRTPLPPRQPGMPDTITIGPAVSNWNPATREYDYPDPPVSPPSFAEDISSVENRAKAMIGKVAVPKNLNSCHRVIARLIEADETRREKQRLSPYPSIFDGPVFDSPFEKRRLRILNGLFLAVAKAGSNPSIRGREAREITIGIGNQHVSITLDRIKPGNARAKSERNAQPSNPDRLRLEINRYVEAPVICTAWQDSGDLTLEAQIQDIAVGIVVYAEHQHRASAIHHYQWLVDQKAKKEEEARARAAEAARLAEERRLALEKQRLDQLTAEAMALRQAAEIRAYVAAMRSAGTSRAPANQQRLDAWAEWALVQADKIDPLQAVIAGELVPPSMQMM